MAITSAELLHPDYFAATDAYAMRNALGRRIGAFQVEAWQDGDQFPVSPVTIALHSMNDTPEAVGRAIDGIRHQVLITDPQILLINAGNKKRTLEAARSAGATVIKLEVGPYFRADMLNQGVKAAEHNYLFQMPAHAALGSNVALAAGMRMLTKGLEGTEGKVGGVYGTLLLDKNASKVERIAALEMGVLQRLRAAPHVETKGMGLLDGSCSMVNRDIVRELGDYPEEFGNGGADGKLGQLMSENGFAVVLDPALSVHHTHGLGWARAALQYLSWKRMAKPRTYKPWLAWWHPHGGL